MSDMIAAFDMMGGELYHALTIKQLEMLIEQSKYFIDKSKGNGDYSEDSILIYIAFTKKNINCSITSTETKVGNHLDVWMDYSKKQ